MSNQSKRRKVARGVIAASASVDWRKKRYGRILGRDVERQLQVYREFAREGQELCDLLETEDGLKIWRELAKSPAWACYYQEPFATLIARFIVLAKAGDVMKSIAALEFPADHIGELEEYLDKQDPPEEKGVLIGLLFALMGNLEAIALFSCTMSDLLERVAKQSCVFSLARAASIDVGVLSLPASQFLMKYLQLSRDVEGLSVFLEVVGKGPHKGRIPYQELRWMEYLLRDQGAFRACSHQDIFDLLVKELKVYGGDAEHPDAKKALFALFRKWRLELAN